MPSVTIGNVHRDDRHEENVRHEEPGSGERSFEREVPSAPFVPRRASRADSPAAQGGGGDGADKARDKCVPACQYAASGASGAREPGLSATAAAAAPAPVKPMDIPD